MRDDLRLPFMEEQLCHLWNHPIRIASIVVNTLFRRVGRHPVVGVFRVSERFAGEYTRAEDRFLVDKCLRVHEHAALYLNTKHRISTIVSSRTPGNGLRSSLYRVLGQVKKPGSLSTIRLVLNPYGTAIVT